MSDEPPIIESTDEARLPATNRRWLLAAAGAVAAGTGATFAWWRLQPGPVSENNDFWSQEFETPSGSPLRMAQFAGQPLVLNFWATWCAPCIREMPLLNAFFNENKGNGWQLLGLAIDQVEPVQRFLTRTPVDYPIAMAGMSGVALSKSLGNTAGGLPFTVVFDAEGKLRQRKLGQVHEADLASWLG